jgi:hypothetical protein
MNQANGFGGWLAVASAVAVTSAGRVSHEARDRETTLGERRLTMRTLCGPLLLLVAVLITAGGCGAGTGAPAEEQANLVEAETFRRELSLEVRNLNFYDAELYAVDEGYRVRIGSVRGNETKTYEFRWLPARDLRIEIRLVAVGTYLSDRLFVNEGDDLQLIIEPDLHRRQPLPRRLEVG